jgi:hypothetical protein
MTSNSATKESISDSGHKWKNLTLRSRHLHKKSEQGVADCWRFTSAPSRSVSGALQARPN